MAAKQDPHTQERLQRFRDFCASRGWDGDGGRWQTAEIANFFGRKANQVSDYLNGTAKSFGPTVANEMALYAGLPPYFFEPTNTMTPVAYQLAKIFDSIPFPDDATRDAAYNAASAALVKFLPSKSAKQ